MEASRAHNRSIIEFGVSYFKTLGTVALVINVAGVIFKICKGDPTFVNQLVGAAASVSGIMTMDRITRTFDEYAHK